MDKFKRLLFFLFGLAFFSCGTKEILKINLPDAEKIKYSIIYLINGDGDYLYHNLKGEPHFADEDKLKEALSVAGNCKNGEVFIFHIMKKSGFLFFQSNDGKFYYYRNGNLINESGYNRNDYKEIFESELELYSKFKTRGENVSRYFLFFGHEIPEFGGKYYYDSYPDRIFNIKTFSNAVGKFTARKKFNLLVLSTCHNGTPGVISRLSPYSDFIIASPEDLHLSYMDTKYFENLDTLKQSAFQFAKIFAKTAFENLINRTQTVTTIVLYDTKKTFSFLNSIREKYASLSPSLQQNAVSKIQYFDLSEKPSFYSGNYSNGVTIFYRPSKFGVNKDKTSHSGWELIEAK